MTVLLLSQAEPVETAIPIRSRRCSRASPSYPGKARLCRMGGAEQYRRKGPIRYLPEGKSHPLLYRTGRADSYPAVCAKLHQRLHPGETKPDEGDQPAAAGDL